MKSRSTLKKYSTKRRIAGNALIAIGVALFSGERVSIASEVPAKSKIIASTQKTPEISPVDGAKNFYDVLSKERQYLTDQAERHRKELKDLYGLFLWIFGAIITLIAAVAGFFGLSQWKNLKEQLISSIRGLFDSEARALVNAEVDAFKSHLKSIDKDLRDLTSYKRKNIVWITEAFSPPQAEGENLATPADQTINDEEIRALHAHGFQDIKVITPTEEEDEKFEIGDCDLAIISYKKTDRSLVRLRRVVSLINGKNPPTYLIIYTFQKSGEQVRIDKAENEILKEFLWYMIANFPATVVAHAQLLVRQKKVLESGNNGQR